MEGTFINALRKNLTDLRDKVESLKNEKEVLKRSLKHTRIAELQTENRQLQ